MDSGLTRSKHFAGAKSIHACFCVYCIRGQFSLFMPCSCIVLVMAMMLLRTFLGRAHASALEATGLLDREVTDPLLEERLIRIRAQITAALALRSVLAEMGFPVPGTIDLCPLVEVARVNSILNRRQAAVLLRINADANEAKHELEFWSRL